MSTWSLAKLSQLLHQFLHLFKVLCWVAGALLAVAERRAFTIGRSRSNVPCGTRRGDVRKTRRRRMGCSFSVELLLLCRLLCECARFSGERSTGHQRGRRQREVLARASTLLGQKHTHVHVLVNDRLVKRTLQCCILQIQPCNVAGFDAGNEYFRQFKMIVRSSMMKHGHAVIVSARNAHSFVEERLDQFDVALSGPIEETFCWRLSIVFLRCSNRLVFRLAWVFSFQRLPLLLAFALGTTHVEDVGFTSSRVPNRNAMLRITGWHERVSGLLM
mmetsp:Transcript_51831/g.130097  ORF Transcript_51831/g.130097 Transcript_51831/m.130097 type:complete len:274 (+) Transcript_51831:1953-2774(+)